MGPKASREIIPRALRGERHVWWTRPSKSTWLGSHHTQKRPEISQSNCGSIKRFVACRRQAAFEAVNREPHVKVCKGGVENIIRTSRGWLWGSTFFFFFSSTCLLVICYWLDVMLIDSITNASVWMNYVRDGQPVVWCWFLTLVFVVAWSIKITLV